jgi:hypothetical protein
VLAQARYWSTMSKRDRPHNLLFLLTSGHMAHAAGTRSFIAQHRPLLDSVVLQLHLEHAAVRAEPREGSLVATEHPEVRWWFTSQIESLESSVLSALAAEDLRRSLVFPPDVFFPQPPTDGAFFFDEGVPLVHFLTAPMYLFDPADTLDKVHQPSLVPLTRAVIRIIDSMASTSATRLRELLARSKGA